MIHTNGAVETLPGPLGYAAIADLIGATLLNHFRLRDGRIVFVDESGLPKGLPHNPEATKLYHLNGGTGPIAGQAVVMLGEDFADGDI